MIKTEITLSLVLTTQKNRFPNDTVWIRTRFVEVLAKKHCVWKKIIDENYCLNIHSKLCVIFGVEVPRI